MIGHRQLTIDDYQAIFRRRWWLLLLPAVLGAGIVYLISLRLPSQYTSQTLVLVEQPTVPYSYVIPIVTQDLNQRLVTMQEQILSRTRLQPIVEMVAQNRESFGQAPIDQNELVDRLRTSISVKPVQPMAGTQSNQLTGFYVSVTLGNARLAQQVCSQVTSMFMEENLHLRQQLSQDTTQFLSRQLDEAKAKLDEQDAKLAEFKRRYLGELPQDEQSNFNLLGALNSQLDAATQALSRVQQDKTFAESALSQQIASWQASQAGHNPQTLEKELSDMQNKLGTLEAHYTLDHPDVIKLKNDIAQLKKKIAAADAQGDSDPERKNGNSVAAEPLQIQELRAQLHQYDSTIKEKTAQQEKIQKQINLYQSRVQLSPAVEQEYKALTRDYQTALNFYNDLMMKKKQSAMATDLEVRQQAETFRVIDPPSLPDKPSFPNRPQFAAEGFGGGLALGFGLILLLEMRDKSLRTERDVEFFLEVPMLALIPEIETPKVSRFGKGAKRST